MRVKKYVYCFNDWRELKVKKVGKKGLPKDSKRSCFVCYVVYKGRDQTIKDERMNTLSKEGLIKYL